MDRRYPENPPGLFDSKTLSGNGSLSYRFTPRFTSGFFAEASKTTYVEKPESQVITVALTSAYEISEVFKGDVKAGASRLEEATTFGTPEERQWVPTGVVGITYHRKDFSTRLESSYGISGGGSYGTATKRGTVLFSMADRFGENWNGNGSLSYQTNRSTTDPVLEDIETWSGMVGIQYTFKPWMSFGVSGTRQYQGSKGSVGDNLRKNMIYIGVTISKTYPLI